MILSQKRLQKNGRKVKTVEFFTVDFHLLVVYFTHQITHFTDFSMLNHKNPFDSGCT